MSAAGAARFGEEQRGLGLLLPAARRRLLPVDDGVACCFIGLPALAGRRQSIVIAAIEQFETALVVGNALRLRTVCNEQERGAVGIFIEMRQPHRLARGLAVLGGAVW